MTLSLEQVCPSSWETLQITLCSSKPGCTLSATARKRACVCCYCRMWWVWGFHVSHRLWLNRNLVRHVSHLGDFIDHLREAIEKQIDNTAAQDILLLQLAKDNANAECRQALMPLQNPTLAGMIEACSKVKATKYQTEQVTKQVTAASQISRSCFQCGQRGHFERN